MFPQSTFIECIFRAASSIDQPIRKIGGTAVGWPETPTVCTMPVALNMSFGLVPRIDILTRNLYEQHSIDNTDPCLSEWLQPKPTFLRQVFVYVAQRRREDGGIILLDGLDGGPEMTRGEPTSCLLLQM